MMLKSLEVESKDFGKMNAKDLKAFINAQISSTLSPSKGIKMGRIPKAEKVKAIEVLRSNTDGGGGEGDDELSLLDELDVDAETSYSKRFEKRLELDRNLKILAENVLKACGEAPGDSGTVAPTTSNSATSPPTPRRRVAAKKMPSIANGCSPKQDSEDNAELIAMIDDLDAETANKTVPTRLPITLDSREDYMSRFLAILLDKNDRYRSRSIYEPNLNPE